MVNAKLSGNDIYNIAESFRKAIIEAKYNREFSSRDRMSNFPGGCCDDSYDLLAYYLHERYNIHTEQVNGVYRDNNPYNTTNHAWLLMNGNLIIDITGDQFKYCAGFSEEVYVGKEIQFYNRLEEKKIYKNHDIEQNERLWNDYQIILSYITERI